MVINDKSSYIAFRHNYDFFTCTWYLAIWP